MMSERDSDSVFFVVYFIVLVALVWGAFEMSGEIRDLQYRIAELEQRK